MLTVTSDDGAGDLHCDTDSHRAERNCSPQKACVSLGSVEMTGGRSPVIEIHEKIIVVHCHFNFTMFAGPQKVTTSAPLLIQLLAETVKIK